MFNDEERNDELAAERIKMNETSEVIIKAMVSSDFGEEGLIAEPENDLSDTLYSDLQDIGLETVEPQVAPESLPEPLPEDLFDDLSDEDSQVKG